ncbi:MAG: lysoplasmalogenase family protein [Candidatus Heimdallarchaeota archaeon]
MNGILAFGVGHIFYLFALKARSPLLLRTVEAGSVADSQLSSRLIPQNLMIWAGFVVGAVVLFFLTVFDLEELVLSIAALSYGVLLITVVAFAVTKWFDDLPPYYRRSLILGLLLFFLSDWVLAVRAFRDSTFQSSLFVGITYILGQLLIHLTPMFASKRLFLTSE